jgi:hypothetical protein
MMLVKTLSTPGCFWRKVLYLELRQLRRRGEIIYEDLRGMPERMRTFTPNATAQARTELVLRLADGSPWRLSLSQGCERFVGYYPRLPGIRADGPLLCYRHAGAPAA